MELTESTRIELTDRLPANTTTATVVRKRGYVVFIGKHFGRPFFWFSDFEPAYVFGRAARMSNQCSGYGIYAATSEVRWNPETQADEHTLFVDRTREYRNSTSATEEQQAVARFAAGLRHTSAYWWKPKGNESTR